MKALVTGATGFIGSSVVRELLKDGVEVRILLRENSDTRNLNGLEVERAYGDIRESDPVESALRGCDILYHTAALYGFWAPDNKAFYEINVEGTKIVLNTALKLGLGKVIYTSSIVAVGSHGGDNLANEESEFNLWETGDHYARSKYLAEVEAMKIYEAGLPLVVVNPAMVIGVRDIKPTPSGKMIVDIVNGKMPGYIDGGINLVDVEDVARGHILAAQKGRTGDRYILGNENMSVSDYFRLIGEVAGVKPPKLKIPYAAAIILGYGYQLIADMIKKPPVLTAPMVRTGSKYAYYDSSKAVTELGLPQTPIRTTVEKAVNWFREKGYLRGG